MFNKKLKEVSNELKELKKEVKDIKSLNKECKKENYMELIVHRQVMKEQPDAYGRVYDILDGVVWHYNADRRYVSCHRDCTGCQFVDVLDIITREIIFQKELHEDEFFTITKVES